MQNHHLVLPVSVKFSTKSEEQIIDTTVARKSDFYKFDICRKNAMINMVGPN